jgi:hypothetical protein
VLCELGFLFLYSEVFCAKTKDVTGELHNDELRNFGKTVRKLIWARQVTRIG